MHACTYADVDTGDVSLPLHMLAVEMNVPGFCKSGGLSLSALERSWSL